MGKEHLARTVVETAASTAAILAIYELLRYSFSDNVRKSMRKRAGYKSEISGTPDTEVPCECSHFDHSRRNPMYDDLSNGQYVTIYEHLAFHQTWTRTHNLGLNRADNQ